MHTTVSYSDRIDKRRKRTSGWGTPDETDLTTGAFTYRDSDTATHVRRRLFPNIKAFANYCESADSNRSYNLKANLDLLRNGDSNLVPQAREIMKRLAPSMPTLTRVWESRVAGFFPNVPAYLGGNPENMWTIETDTNDSAPVRIWVNILPSGGCSTPQLLQRGATIVALTMCLLQRKNNVRVTAYADQPCDSYYDRSTKTTVKPGVVIAYDLPTSPPILAQLCTALGHPNVVRNLSMHAAELTDPHINGGWLEGHEPMYGYNEQKVRKDLDAAPDDIILPALHLYDPCITEPLEFIKRELTRILGPDALVIKD